MERFEEAAQIDTEPFDSDLLDEIYVRPYATEVYMTDVFAILLIRYFEAFDRKYGTDVSQYVSQVRLIGYDSDYDMNYMIWYNEASDLLAGAMDDTGWYMKTIGTNGLRDYFGSEEALEDEQLFQAEYEKCLNEELQDGFLKDALLNESRTMMEITKDMEEGNLVIVWNPELNDYMQFREEHPDVIEAVCKEEDQWIVKLEEDIWEPYMAFYQQDKKLLNGEAYCKVVLGCYVDAYVSFEAINPNWICKAVKLYKMLQLAKEKLACFQIGRKTTKAA